MKTYQMLMAVSLLLAASARGTKTLKIDLNKHQIGYFLPLNVHWANRDNLNFFTNRIMQDNSDYGKKKYRLYNNEKYEILDNGSIYIYYRYESEELIKGKEMIKTDKYYFSKDGSSEIVPLTIENLKKAFPEDHKFHYELDAEFRSDKELLAYDKYLKTYKVEYLYSQSLK
jgi:hypothetical protein